jgi:hypothetical protein
MSERPEHESEPAAQDAGDEANADQGDKPGADELTGDRGTWETLEEVRRGNGAAH